MFNKIFKTLDYGAVLCAASSNLWVPILSLVKSYHRICHDCQVSMELKMLFVITYFYFHALLAGCVLAVIATSNWKENWTTNCLFLAPTEAQEVLICVCSSVHRVQVCLELILLARNFKLLSQLSLIFLSAISDLTPYFYVDIKGL